MSQVTISFTEPMAVPPDGSGVSITDSGGNTLGIVGVSAGSSSEILLYNGAWTPADPVPGIDTVTINYVQANGDLQSLVGYDVGDFSGICVACGNATNLNAIPISANIVSLSWDESLDDPTVTYELFRNSVSVQTFIYGENTYVDNGLTEDTYYEYELHTLYAGNSIGSITDWTRTPAIVQLAVVSSLSKIPFHSFDLQRTLTPPLNTGLPAFNSARFSFLP